MCLRACIDSPYSAIGSQTIKISGGPQTVAVSKLIAGEKREGGDNCAFEERLTDALTVMNVWLNFPSSAFRAYKGE
jgi:hypothetical protein